MSASNPDLERVAAAGFSLVELLIVATLGLVVLGLGVLLLRNGQQRFDAELERADVQQRLRSGIETISRNLSLAGGGLRYSGDQRFLGLPMASVFPYRHGTTRPEDPRVFKSDTVTVVYALPESVAQTTIGQPRQASSGTAAVNLDAGCPRQNAACGFSAGMDVMLFDETGSFDTFRLKAVQHNLLEIDHTMPDTSHSYPSGSHLVEAAMATFTLRRDQSAGTFQLVRDEGSNEVPVVDHVVALVFEYFGEPHPPALLPPPVDPAGPWTTYGPRPPPAGMRTTAYGPGENCAFTIDAATHTLIPRLTELGSGEPALVKLTPEQLTDGPWCPDASDPHRYDADLLRIRRISVTLRVEASLSALRGSAGPLFSQGGSALSVARWVPDEEVHFDITPKNLNLGR